MNKLIPLLLLLPLLGCAHHRGDGASDDFNHAGAGDKVTDIEPVVLRHYSWTVSPILFEFDRAVISDEGKATANWLLEELSKRGKATLDIEGHTCDIGTTDYNLALGVKRAQAVADYMILRGADPARITVTTFGEELPAVLNDSETNRAKNRRAEWAFR